MFTMKKHSISDNKKRRNIIIIASVAGAFILFTLAGLLAYLPGRMSTTSYDFLYTMNYAAHGKYRVENSKLKVEPIPKYDYMRGADDFYGESTNLYRYDSANDKQIVISDSDAEKLTLNEDSESPDGYSVIVKYNNNNFNPTYPLTGVRDGSYGDFNVFFRKGISNRKLNIERDNSDSYYDFQFIAWIVEE